MWPAAKRGLHTDGRSPPNGRSTPALRKRADKASAPARRRPASRRWRASRRATGRLLYARNATARAMSSRLVAESNGGGPEASRSDRRDSPDLASECGPRPKVGDKSNSPRARHLGAAGTSACVPGTADSTSAVSSTRSRRMPLDRVEAASTRECGRPRWLRRARLWTIRAGCRRSTRPHR